MCDVGAGCSGTWANMRKMVHCGNLSADECNPASSKFEVEDMWP